MLAVLAEAGEQGMAFDDVLAVGAAEVNAGQALRARERSRQWFSGRRGYVLPPLVDPLRAVLAGQRKRARGVLYTQMGYGQIEWVDREARIIRLTPKGQRGVRGG